jgi:hypothetical protein
VSGDILPAWLPSTCENGHPLGPALVSLSFKSCPGCPATTDGRGHHVYYCRVNGCRSAPAYPPEHVGPRV